MPKMKTVKAVAKRFKVKKSKTGSKIMKRRDGQGHFNSRETGKVKRNKRTDITMSPANKKTITRALNQ